MHLLDPAVAPASPLHSGARCRSIAPHTLNPRARLRLICCPYAGGSAVAFHEWSAALQPEIVVLPLHLPGRDHRFSEPPLRSLEAVVEMVVADLEPYLDVPIAIFGHSMGALIAFELARNLTGSARLVRLFLSGREAPHLAAIDKRLHALPDVELVGHLRSLEGTSEEVLQNAELLECLVPRVRADFAICETYKHAPRPALDCPITVYGGEDDADVRPQGLLAWQQHTMRPLRLRLFPGGHFFLRTARAQLLAAISADLEVYRTT